MSDATDSGASINYELLVEDALRNVVRGALSIVQHAGLPGETHFYISFLTDHPDVEMDDSLRAANSGEMTIVLQHQFWDLQVEPDSFSVTLSFSGRQQPLSIPFAAVTQFTDPSVGFSLQFKVSEADNDSEEQDTPPADNAKMASLPDKDSKQKIPADAAAEDGADIVSLDAFRKRPAPKQ